MSEDEIETTKELLLNDILALAKEDIECALMVVTGAFVGLNVAFVALKTNGSDALKEITVTGPEGQRKITIHAA